jgi:predicted nucleic acid-binding protein
MQLSEDLKKELNFKTVLLDTCVLSTIRKNMENPIMQDFLNMLEDIDCHKSINDLIKLEFLRDANKFSEFLTRKLFIKELCENISLRVDEEMYENAMKLSYIYVKHQLKGVELVDLMTSAFLKRYSHGKGLILVTENHKDFSPLIHDRIGEVVFSFGKEWKTFGFYKINEEKWKTKLKDLNESKEWNNL